MTKTLTGYDILVYVKMSYLHSNCHYWAKDT